MRLILLLLILLLPNTFLGQSDCSVFTPELAAEIKREVELYELELISNGYLKNDNPKSFIQFYQENAKSLFENVNRSSRPVLDQHVYALTIGGCRTKIEQDSDLKELEAYQKKMEAFGRSLSSQFNENLGAEKMAILVSEQLTVKDIRTPSVKRSYLLSLYAITWGDERGTIGSTIIAPKYEEPATKFITEFIITKDDEFLMDRVEGDSAYIASTLENTIRELGNDVTIILQANRQSTYSKYLKAIDLINAVFNKLYNELSEREFKKPFSSCNETQQSIIKSTIKKQVYFKPPN